MIVINLSMICFLAFIGLWLYRVISNNNAKWIEQVAFGLATFLLVGALIAKLWLGVLIWGIMAIIHGKRAFA